MENVAVKMLESIKSFAKGEVYEIDAETATKWIAAGVAEKSDAVDQIDAKLAGYVKAMEDREARLLDTITKAASNPIKLPNFEPEQKKASLGDFCKAVADGDAVAIKAMGGSSGEAGGFTVPVEHGERVMSVEPVQAIVRPRANIQTMTSDTKECRAINQSTNVYGGVLCYYEGEADTITESELKYKKIKLEAKKLTGLVVVSNELNDDSADNVEADTVGMFQKAFLSKEDKECLVGNGVHGPLGVKNSGAALTVQRTTAGQIKFEDVTKMESKMLPNSTSAVWVAHISTMPQIVYLKDAAGNPIYVQSAREGGFPTLRGRPVLFTDKTPALGVEGDLMYVDFSWYYLGTRKEFTVAFSDHYKFATDQRAFRFTMRHDGQNALNQPITLDDGSTQVSNIVLLTNAA